MKRYGLLRGGLGLAVVFWLFDSALHYYGYEEPVFEWIPSDGNEPWMRIIICITFVAFGAYAGPNDLCGRGPLSHRR